MKLETLRLLKNMESILDDIFISLKSDIKDRIMYSFIMAKLSNIGVGHFNIIDNKLIIDNSKHSKEERFELIFIPSFQDYKEISALYYTDEYTFEKTIKFDDSITTIEETTIDNRRFLNNYKEKRVYKEDELIYSIYQEKVKDETKENGYKYVTVENYFDGITAKSKLSNVETIDDEVILEEYKYKKKDLEKKIPLDNKKEKSIYGTRKLCEESLVCSQTEFDKFIEYWKELHESYEPIDITYLKKGLI